MKDGITIERACELSELRGVLKARQVKLCDIADAAGVDPGLITRQLQGERNLTVADAFEYGWRTRGQFQAG